MYTPVMFGFTTEDSNLNVWIMDISRRMMSLPNFLLRLMSAQLMSTTASTRSLPIERAFFTQLSPRCDNSDDVFGIMVFDELVKKFELKVRARG